MPPRRNYIRFFSVMTLAVEKKVSQLIGYVWQLSPHAVGEMQERMLMDLTSKLREAIDHLQLRWTDKREEILVPHFEGVRGSVAKTNATGEAALRKAEQFVVRGNNGRSLSRAIDSQSDRLDRLDNTLKPPGPLTRNMMLKEANNSIMKFDEWFKWNTAILSKKDNVTQRVLLENFLDERLLSKIKSDITVTNTTPI